MDIFFELFMDVMLNDDDVVTLGGLLRDSLPELKWEVARTDSKPVRDVLAKRRGCASDCSTSSVDVQLSIVQ
jgi:hypothetical protein